MEELSGRENRLHRHQTACSDPVRENLRESLSARRILKESQMRGCFLSPSPSLSRFLEVTEPVKCVESQQSLKNPIEMTTTTTTTTMMMMKESLSLELSLRVSPEHLWAKSGQTARHRRSDGKRESPQSIEMHQESPTSPLLPSLPTFLIQLPRKIIKGPYKDLWRSTRLNYPNSFRIDAFIVVFIIIILVTFRIFI